MYTNLLLFLVAIFLFSMDSVPETPLLPEWQGLMLFVVFLAGYGAVARILFRRPQAARTAGYFRTERLLSVVALFFYGLTLYFCDPKYYLSLLSLGKTMPALVNFAGLALFVLFLVFMWLAGKRNYEQIFARKYATSAFIVSNIKANLPIALPWIILSLLYDIVALIPLPGLQRVFASAWGDMLFFSIFLVFVVIFFPPLVKNLWGCKRLPEGYLKDHLQAFCAKQDFTADFYLWPLFEGRVLTAAVMGIVPGLRYILITPALIETLTLAEMEAVMAHEIGHVKKYHLPLYILLIGGFSLLAGLLAEPLVYLLLSTDFLSNLIIDGGISAENALTMAGGVPLLVFMLVYFRFVFGYFIRNFERQADLFSLASIGNSRGLVSAFEKIAVMGGNIRDERNWHHFGIGERIDCLEQAERQPGRIKRHNHKVRNSLLAYLAAICIAMILVRQIPTESLAREYQESFAETVLMQKAKQEPDRALWQRLIGDLMQSRRMERQALAAYKKAFELEPANPEVLNNFAWLLLTSEDISLRDPVTALFLARSAAVLEPKGYVLDTLATAFWANGLVDEAVRAEKQAMEADVAMKRYYQAQITRFTTESYEESLQKYGLADGEGQQMGKKTP